MSNPLEEAKALLKRAAAHVSIDKDMDLYEEIGKFLRRRPRKEKADLNQYLVTTESDGLETIFHGDGCIIVPIETLDAERKECIEGLDYEKLLNHGGEFPGIYLSEIFEELDKVRMLKPIIDACRETRKRLDASELEE